ncbi:MAG: NAD-dependent epimerase [Bacteroidales bacterium]|nr:NAD-dependent epimerase [Bacteroidales bacterium]
MKILITGTAGFIGSHLAEEYINKGYEVFGLDNINDYYDVNLKLARLQKVGINKSDISYNLLTESKKYPNYRFIKLDLKDKAGLDKLFFENNFDYVCNLAAQAGVRYSLTNPDAYINSNIIGFVNILEACRHNNIKHLVYASSSSVYGLNENMPFSTSDNVDHPISLYAASKKSNELTAHAYSHLFQLPTTGLRFFTVYGPWGRPDMALFLFTEAILNNKPINIFNNGDMQRDFTFIDDIIQGIKHVTGNPPKGDESWSGLNPNPASSSAPYKLYNIGNNNPIQLMDFISEIEKALNKKAIKNYMPIQQGDVPATYADVSDLIKNFSYKPNTSIKTGIKKFIDWYREYYNKQ